MAFMGYETPVEMPSMGVYNTDLMKMYIAGVKDQYEKGQEELKDFMKQYGDFYSDINGATQLYNDLTIGGARNMIDQMYANGIDPFKNPEARAAISKYIYTRPTGKLNEMKRSAENAKKYIEAANKMKQSGLWGSDDFQRWANGGKLLEEWDAETPFTLTTPFAYQGMDELTQNEFAPFKAQEYLRASDRPGFAIYGTSDANKEKAVQSALNRLGDTVAGNWQREVAARQVDQQIAASGVIVSPEDRQKMIADQLKANVYTSANKYFQEKEDEDPLAMHREKERISAAYRPVSYGGGGGSSRVSVDDGDYYAPERYSRLTQVANSTQGQLHNWAKHNHPFGAKEVNDENGRPVIAIETKNTGNGTFVGSDGKRYRQMTQGEQQAAMFKSRIKTIKGERATRDEDVNLQVRTVGGRQASWNAFDMCVAITGEVPKSSEITYAPGATELRLYDPRHVMGNAKGFGLTASQDDLKQYTQDLRNAVKNFANSKSSDGSYNAPIIYDTHQTAEIVLKDGRIGVYTKVLVDYGEGRKEALAKIAEYDKNHEITDRWSVFTGEEDRRLSTFAVGTADAVEISNVKKQ